jgi:hypothetical protein
MYQVVLSIESGRSTWTSRVGVIALLAIWAIEIRAGKDIWADMGDYWGLSGNKEKTRYFW